MFPLFNVLVLCSYFYLLKMEIDISVLAHLKYKRKLFLPHSSLHSRESSISSGLLDLYTLSTHSGVAKDLGHHFKRQRPVRLLYIIQGMKRRWYTPNFGRV